MSMNDFQHTRVSRSRFSTKRLVSGEQILWEGRPSIIAYFLRSLLLAVFGGIFALLAVIQDGIDIDVSDLGSYIAILIMAVLALSMFILHRRWGLGEGLVAVIVILIVALNFGVTPLLYFVPAIIGLVALIIDYMVWSHTYFAISDRRIMTQTGIFSLMFVDTQIDRIQNVSVSQPFIERILGYGDVMFATSGEMGGIKSDVEDAKMRTGGAIMWENVPKPFDVRKTAESIIFRATKPQVQYVQQYAPAPVAAPAPAPSGEIADRLAKLKEMRDKNLVTEEEYQKKRQEIIGRL
ncbi:MAG: PH domain-containing protein [Methanomassiliicoccus sp.]|nr:PH domain-containing protein [Methanomassiliicoccus sp.]